MRHLLVALTLAVALAAASTSRARAQENVTHAIDALKSKASFTVQHVFVEHVTGTVPIVGGSVVLSPDSLIPSSVSAELDPSKVSTGDRDRDAALVSADFFDVKADPVWTFTSTRITALGTAAFDLDGTLTIHGVAAPEHLDVTVRNDGAHRVYRAVGHIARQAFHMAMTRLDPVIGKVVDVTLDIVLK